MRKIYLGSRLGRWATVGTVGTGLLALTGCVQLQAQKGFIGIQAGMALEHREGGSGHRLVRPLPIRSSGPVPHARPPILWFPPPHQVSLGPNPGAGK